MSSFKIDIQNLPNLKAKLAQIPQNVGKQVKAELEAFGFATVEQAKRLAPVDEGHLRSSISHKVVTVDKGLVVEIVVATDYAAYLEFGTRKFAAAYVSTLPPDWQTFAATFRGPGGGSLSEMIVRLMAWVRRKGFAAQRTKSGNRSNSKASLHGEEQAAYAIALQILLNGVKAHPFLFPAVRDQKKLLIDRLNAQFSK